MNHGLIIFVIVAVLANTCSSSGSHWTKWWKPGMPKHGGKRIESKFPEMPKKYHNYRLYRPSPLLSDDHYEQDETASKTEYIDQYRDVLELLKVLADTEVDLEVNYLEEELPTNK